MTAAISRIIVFTSDMVKVTAFYRDVLALKAIVDPEYPADEWIEFDAGGVRIALHKAGSGGSGTKATCRHKIVFYARYVAKERARLIKKKVKAGPVKTWGKLSVCDFSDPEGNRLQLSNRK